MSSVKEPKSKDTCLLNLSLLNIVLWQNKSISYPFSIKPFDCEITWIEFAARDGSKDGDT